MAEKTGLELMAADGADPALRHLASRYFKDEGLEFDLLKGDGSDRRIFRIRAKQDRRNSVIGVVHANLKENEDFFLVTRAFHQAAIPAPILLAVDELRTAYLLSDLGPDTLADRIAVWQNTGAQADIVRAYETVLRYLVTMQNDLAARMDGFLKNRVMDRTIYSADIDYFLRDFVIRFGFQPFWDAKTRQEIETCLLEPLAEVPADCFVYRDFQSRNIMWRSDGPWFIDYQSALRGPRYYDPASLLYSSRSGLDQPLRAHLLRFFCEQSQLQEPFDHFAVSFYRFVLIRRLRSLGTYGFLSVSKGKSRFRDHIQPTLIALSELLKRLEFLPALSTAIDGMATQWLERSAQPPKPG